MRAIIPVILFLLLGLTWVPVAAQDENVLETEDHLIYYNVLPTSALPEAMAQAYGITRSDTRILLNITVQERDGDDRNPVAARINAQAVNLNGQLRRFRMREITEEEAIYYIGDISVNEGETLDFELEVAPEGKRNPETIEFRRKF